MPHASSPLALIGGLALIIGALAFVAVFSYLAARFDYPQVLDGEAEQVLPRLRSGGSTMRAVWALYAVLPLLLILGAGGVSAALPSSSGLMALARLFAAVGALAMCLGLMRWPSLHWELARAYESAGPESRHTLSALFRGLNLYLGNYIGEFLGEVCLAFFFALSGVAMGLDSRYPSWLGLAGALFGLLFFIGALRNITDRVQWLADINNYLLPLWMIVLGAAVIWRG
ncbi:DUF4386 family protein [Pelomonas sp. SE-A7]|uniref:DUF4386 family protein n=1 Tax=Pelomonas sp. SE-A7 TaxID=3054953 RepID=UPI00259C6EF9|nr:DUF4386 family protein [Pelomonas sp. SE-A7]MDM4765382.1 DUF4386 family protein [Pelomonas sp. SE-A7]